MKSTNIKLSKTEGITIFSCFDGMGCAAIALREMGVKVKTYYSSEVNKFAMKVVRLNFPDVIELGDITKIKASDLPHIDLMVGGSPCQGFSFAGKKLNFDDPRSKLFFEFERLRTKIQPTHYFLENVMMLKQHQNIISNMMGAEPIIINSSLLTAQNRRRNYWLSWCLEQKDLFGTFAPNIPQPADRNIFIRDILEDLVVEKKFFLSAERIQKLIQNSELQKTIGNSFSFSPKGENEKATALTVGGQGSKTGNYLKIDRYGTVKNNQDKASTIQVSGSGDNSDMDLLLLGNLHFGRSDTAKAERVENLKSGNDSNSFNDKVVAFVSPDKAQTLCIAPSRDSLIAMYQVPRGKNKGGFSDVEKCATITSNAFEQNNFIVQGCAERVRHDGEGCQIEYNQFGKANSLLSQNPNKSMVAIKKVVQLNPSTQSNGCQPYQQDRFYSTNGKAKELCHSLSIGSNYIYDGIAIRRFTPLECCRLQGIPDGYDWGDTSDSQKYKMLGNGWTVPVIMYLLDYVFEK